MLCPGGSLKIKAPLEYYRSTRGENKSRNMGQQTQLDLPQNSTTPVTAIVIAITNTAIITIDAVAYIGLPLLLPKSTESGNGIFSFDYAIDLFSSSAGSVVHHVTHTGSF